MSSVATDLSANSYVSTAEISPARSALNSCTYSPLIFISSLQISCLCFASSYAVRNQTQQKHEKRRTENTRNERNATEAGTERTDETATNPGADDADDCGGEESTRDRPRNQHFPDIRASCSDYKEENKTQNTHFLCSP